MNTENMESILRRIAKLLAIAQDDRANPQEAAAAASMAEKIMRKYQLEQADVIIVKLRQGDEMWEADCVATAKTNGTKVLQVPVWCSQLAVCIANFNETVARIHRSNGEATVRFYGFKADVIVCTYMFDYLVATVNRLCKQFRQHPTYLEEGRTAMNEYRAGVSHGIIDSVNKALVEKKAEVRTSNAGNALVIAKAQAVAQRFGSMKTKTVSTNVKREDNYAQGFAVGKQVNISTAGLNNSGDKALMIGR